jgi:hypothetical protein
MYITRTCGLWSDENPHAIHSARHQQQFSVNVWASIVGDNLIGPHILPNRLNGEEDFWMILSCWTKYP